MAFIQQSRLIRTATRNVDDTITFHNPPLQVARFPGIVRSLESAINALTPVPDANQWGGYALAYDPRFLVYTTVAGTHSNAANLLVVFYDVWEDAADQAANPTTPPYRNTHTMQLDGSLNANQLRQKVIAVINETVMRHAVENRLGDMRDLLLVATQSDPTGILGRANPLNDTTRTVDTRDDTAPQLPNPEAP